MLTRFKLQGATQEAVFTVTATEDQGLLTTIAPNGYRYMIPKTFFNRSTRIQMIGPLTDTEWEQLKTLPIAGPYYRYYIRQNHLYFSPVGVAGHICAFLYQSAYGVLDGDTPTVAKQYATKDNDTYIFPDEMMLSGVEWLWRSTKGLDYAEDFRAFEVMINNHKSNTVPSSPALIDGSQNGITPGILVPLWRS